MPRGIRKSAASPAITAPEPNAQEPNSAEKTAQPAATLLPRVNGTILIDVKNANPNGDPGLDGIPRTNPFTRKGHITDVSVKRRIRNLLERSGGVILCRHGVSVGTVAAEAMKKDNPSRDDVMEGFIDARLFGAMSTKSKNTFSARGPVQFSMGESLDPVVVQITQITNVSPPDGEKVEETKSRGMGTKSSVLYGLYRMNFSIDPYLASAYGLTQDEIDAMYQIIARLYDGLEGVEVVGLHVFEEHPTHDPAENRSASLGVMTRKKLLDRIKITRNSVDAPDKFDDYTVEIDQSPLPATITHRQIV